MNSNIREKVDYLTNYDGEPIKIMEVCGTHTAGIFKSGIRTFLSPKIKLISGPGCPVCVTPTSFIDKCNEYALKDNHTLISFGDMLKVPGQEYSLSQVKGIGGNVAMVYSPFDIIKAAKNDPSETYVVAAVGFETTTPVFGLFAEELINEDVKNVKLLTSLKSAIPAIDWVCGTEKDIDAFLCPGHVAVITGSKVFSELCTNYKKPFVIAGFEELHIMDAIYNLVRDVESLRDGNLPEVKNLYKEAVKTEGNIKAKEVLNKYFVAEDATWRGLGQINSSGFYLKEQFSWMDAGSKGLEFDKSLPEGCKCADVITGRIDPDQCPVFGKKCTPVSPYGPCMVSGEGACGIWYQNR